MHIYLFLELLSQSWWVGLLLDYIEDAHNLLNLSATVEYPVAQILDGVHLTDSMLWNLLLSSVQKGSGDNVDWGFKVYSSRISDSSHSLVKLLETAAEFGHSQVMTLLLTNGADVRPYDKCKLLAARHGHVKCLEILLRREKRASDCQHYAALHMVAMCGGPYMTLS